MAICRLLLLVAILMTGKVVSQNYVCLKAVVIENQVLLECKIDKFSYNVEFITPSGSAYGSCHPPTPPELKAEHPIDCGNNIIQYIDRNTTVLRLENPKALLGVWTCKHGSGWSNDTINITSLFIEQNVQPGITNGPTSNHDSYCLGLVHVAVVSLIFLIILIIGFVLSYLVFSRTSGDGIKEYVIGWLKRIPSNHDREIESPQLLANISSELYCKKCNQSACSLCDTCIAFFCGACFKVHNDKFKDHDVCTLEQTLKAKGKFDVKCSICDIKQSKYYCKTHKRLVCSSCECGNSERFVVKCERIRLVRPTDHSDKKIKSVDNRYIGELTVKVSRGKDITVHDDRIRICGLCALPGNILVIADTNYKELLWFQNYEYKDKMHLLEEPKGLAHLFDTRFAISFPQIATIEIYEFKDKILTNIKTIDLKEYGKPFSIAYNNDRFAVEIGEGDSGYIGIFDYDGQVLERIRNANLAYFTGNTIRLALDTKHEKVFVSALGLKKLSCLNFSGDKQWSIEMPSPRSVLWIPDDVPVGNGKLLVASKRNDIIYKVNPEDGDRNMILSDNTFCGPRYMTYDKAEQLLYVNGDYGKVHVYKYPSIE